MKSVKTVDKYIEKAPVDLIKKLIKARIKKNLMNY